MKLKKIQSDRLCISSFFCGKDLQMGDKDHLSKLLGAFVVVKLYSSSQCGFNFLKK